MFIYQRVYATNNHNGNINNNQRVFTNHVTQKDHCHIFFEFVSWDDEIPIWKVIKIHGSKAPTRRVWVNSYGTLSSYLTICINVHHDI